MTATQLYAITVDSSPYLGYAHAFNNIPFINGISIATDQALSFQDVNLVIRVRINGVDICDEVTATIALLGMNKRFDTGEFGPSGALRVKFVGERLANLLQIDSIQAAYIEVELTQYAVIIAKVQHPIWVMPARFWAYRNDTTALLAAYVLHHHPIIPEIIGVARDLYAKRGIKNSFEGYQGNAAEIDRQVQSIYEALLSYNIGYINPPSSWEINVASNEGGQIVRTPEQVIGQRLGTCLDTTILLAAILEHIGIYPILIIIPGHAFLGYWRVRKNLMYPVMPISQALNHVDAGQIGLVETTRFASHKDSFAQSQQIATHTLMGADLADTHSIFVDVFMTRLHEIRPLPAVIINQDGGTTIIESGPMGAIIIDSENNKIQPVISETNMPKRIVQWRNRLLDLSLMNRLINFRIERSAYVRIPVASSQLGLLEDILNVDKIIIGKYQDDRLYPLVDAYMNRGSTIVHETVAEITAVFNQLAKSTVNAHLPPARFAPVMRKIARMAKNITDQTGVNQLYLALGSLVWSTESIRQTLNSSERQRQESQNPVEASVHGTNLLPGEIRSPLLLIPINLRPIKGGDHYAVTLDETSPIMPNFSLLEKLSRELKFELPELRDPKTDEHGYDIPWLFNAIRQRISAEDRPFRVDETCVIGFFDFGNYRLWRDLGDNWPKYIQKPLVKQMVEHAGQPFMPTTGEQSQDTDLDELAGMLPIPSDSSQLEAIRKALAKQTFVLQGPPGTGKSQTIANLIFAALHKNYRVLFVTEKSTAAQVVYDRLASIKGDNDAEGIETMVLDIHDQDSKPERIKAQIKRALDMAIEPDTTGYAVHKFNYEQYLQVLKQYPKRLHEKGQFGESIYTARDKLLALPDVPTVDIPAQFFVEKQKEDLERVRQSLQKVQNEGNVLGQAHDNPWRFVGRSITPQVFKTEETQTTTKQLVQDFYDLMRALDAQPVARDVMYAIPSLDVLRHVNAMVDPHIVKMDQAKIFATTENVALRRSIRTHLQQIRVWRGEVLELQPQAVDIAFPRLFKALGDAEKSFIFGRAARITTAKQNIMKYIKRGDFDNFNTVEAFASQIEQQQQVIQQLRRDVRNHPEWNISSDWNPLEPAHIEHLEQLLYEADQQVAYVSDTTNIPATIHQSVVRCNATERALVANCCHTIQALVHTLDANMDFLAQNHTSRSAIQAVIALHQELYMDAIQSGFLMLYRWLNFQHALTVLYEYQMHAFIDSIIAGRFDYPMLANIFERSFLTHHLQRLLRVANFVQFDHKKHDIHIQQFSRASQDVRKYIPGIVVGEMLAARQDYIRTNSGEITNLKRELERTRRQLKVRQLLSTYGELIKAIMPCTIASPNSVAMLLDAESRPYDIVIFDEASQIRVTHAICGIGRGDATIIVGDSRQMPPTSIAEKTFFEEDEDTDTATMVSDEESILTECVAMQVDSLTLSWHYRSADEMLIAFSNTAYYDGKLSAFPSPADAMKSQSVAFVKVDGQYIRRTTNLDTTGDRALGSVSKKKSTHGLSKSDLLNTNPVEAQAIYRYLVELASNPATSQLSVGIVTFNEKQADLIESYVSGTGADKAVAERFAYEASTNVPRWFIKSLETIQGDEADIILFSVAFSKNEQGKLPLQFGPLNKVGGERRLNVAVTRARRQVVVFCSFEPEELHSEDSSSRGVRDLRDYLILAKHGPDASAKTGLRKTMAQRHRDAIAQAFRDAGYQVRADYGLTDFRVDLLISDVNNPNRMVGVLLDGPAWERRKTVIDRDVLPVEMLTQRMGWPAITRIWFPTWIRNQAEEIWRIGSMLRELPDTRLTGDGIPLPTSHHIDLGLVDSGDDPDLDPSEVQPLPMDVEDELPYTKSLQENDESAETETPNDVTSTPSNFASTQWIPWTERVVGDKAVLDQLNTRSAKDEVINLIHEIVDCEAPIHSSRLATLVGHAYGYGRVTETRAKQINDIIRGIKQDKESFYFPRSLTHVHDYTQYRPQDSTTGQNRVFEEISIVELANAASALVRQHNEIDEEILLVELMRTFGGARLTAGIRERLQEALKFAVRKKYMVKIQQRYTVQAMLI